MKAWVPFVYQERSQLIWPGGSLPGQTFLFGLLSARSVELASNLLVLTEVSSHSSKRRSGTSPRRGALALLIVGLAITGGVITFRSRVSASKPAASPAGSASVKSSQSVELPPAAPAGSSASRVRRAVAPLTAELRKKGYHECNPPDPLGMGPYMPFARAGMGHIMVPQRGGHTLDYGYDVIVHFHGAAPVRKTLVQVARGVVFVGVDLGNGSGKYSDAFTRRESFPEFRASIEAALKRQSGQSQAHIRHLALSAWSAGYGAINEILKFGDQNIDAVVLLDALHAGWEPGHRHDGTVKSMNAAFIAPTIEFARRALRGERILVFTHSYVDPVTYPSTSLTAQLLLSQLGLVQEDVSIQADFLTQVKALDQVGLHVWSYRGHDELAHCAHISLMARILSDILEEAWDTPEMDRNVPAVKLPALGTSAPPAVGAKNEQ